MGKKFYAMMAVLAFAAGSMDVNAVIWMTWDRFLMSGKKRTG